jgi:hypothetical protein
MIVSPFLHGDQVRFLVLAHESVTVGATSTPLPNIPTGDVRKEIKRTVLRGDGDFFWTADGSDPSGPDAFPALADEVLVWDGIDLEAIRMFASASVDLRVIYMC